MAEEDFSHILQPYFPEESIQNVIKWISDYKIIFTITQKRNSVLGDYHSPYNNQGHRISVNGDLNRYSFLITFLHEMAHLTTWEKYRRSVPSHGMEWKEEFKVVSDELRGKKIFPRDVTAALKRYLINPSATHCVDPDLVKVLNTYNKKSVLHLDDLREGMLFSSHGNRTFRKGERLRKRFKCYEIKTNRIYLFSPMAEIKKVEDL
ncbi:MAG: hypothetical protein H0W62_12670 [Chitinophagales bacterium]|nr:hypothetical protein [Chitinophagales bacterium]